VGVSVAAGLRLRSSSVVGDMVSEIDKVKESEDAEGWRSNTCRYSRDGGTVSRAVVTG
jgi:hypothetical protein